MNKTGRHFSLFTFHFSLVVVMATLLLLTPNGDADVTNERWSVEHYDAVFRDLLDVSINDIEVSSQSAREVGVPTQSRLRLHLRIRDASQVQMLTLNGLQLPLDRGVLDIDVFVPYGHRRVIELALNGEHYLSVKASYGVGGAPEVRNLLEHHRDGLQSNQKAIAAAEKLLKIDPYNIRAYQLLIGAADSQSREVRDICYAQIVDSLLSVPKPGNPAGLNVCALYALAETPSNSIQTSGQEEMVEYYQHLLDFSPFFAPAHVSLAKLYKRRGDLDATIYHLTLAQRMNPSDAFNLQRTEIQPLIDTLKSGLRGTLSNKTKALQHANLEFVLHRDMKVVGERYKNAHDAAQEDVDLTRRVRFNTALLEFQNGNPAAAQNELQALLQEVDSRQPTAFSRAIYSLLLAVTAHPANSLAEKAKLYQHARWWLAHYAEDAQVRLPQEDEVLMAQAFVYLNPYDPRYLNNFAIVLADRGYVSEAAKRLRQALAVSSNWREPDREKRRKAYQSVLRNLSQCYTHLNRRRLGKDIETLAGQLDRQ